MKHAKSTNKWIAVLIIAFSFCMLILLSIILFQFVENSRLSNQLSCYYDENSILKQNAKNEPHVESVGDRSFVVFDFEGMNYVIEFNDDWNENENSSGR